MFLGLFTGRQREDDFQLIDYLGLGVGETGRRQAEVREAALTYWAKCGWALEPQETISNNGENPLPRHVKWAQMVCALGWANPVPWESAKLKNVFWSSFAVSARSTARRR